MWSRHCSKLLSFNSAAGADVSHAALVVASNQRMGVIAAKDDVRTVQRKPIPSGVRPDLPFIYGTRKTFPVYGHFTLVPAGISTTSTRVLLETNGLYTKPGLPTTGWPKGMSFAGDAGFAAGAVSVSSETVG